MHRAHTSGFCSALEHVSHSVALLPLPAAADIQAVFFKKKPTSLKLSKRHLPCKEQKEKRLKSRLCALVLALRSLAVHRCLGCARSRARADKARWVSRFMHFPDSNRHSVEGDKRDDLSGNAWFKKTQKLAGDKKFIHAQAEKACERPRPCIPPDTYRRVLSWCARGHRGTTGPQGQRVGRRAARRLVSGTCGGRLCALFCSLPACCCADPARRAELSADVGAVCRTGHSNVTCADYGCYAQWSATKVAIL